MHDVGRVGLGFGELHLGVGVAVTNSNLVVLRKVHLLAILNHVPLFHDLVSHRELSGDGGNPLGVCSAIEVSVNHATILNEPVITPLGESVRAGAGPVPGLEELGIGGARVFHLLDGVAPLGMVEVVDGDLS